MWECRVGHRLKTRGFSAFRRWQRGRHGQRKWGKGGRGYEDAAEPHTSALAAAEIVSGWLEGLCNNLFYAENQLLSLLLSLQLSSAVLGIGERVIQGHLKTCLSHRALWRWWSHLCEGTTVHREKCALLGTSSPPGRPSMEALSGLPPSPQSKEKSCRWLWMPLASWFNLSQFTENF